MKIILVKAYAGTLYSSTNELSWEKKKQKTRLCVLELFLPWDILWCRNVKITALGGSAGSAEAAPAAADVPWPGSSTWVTKCHRAGGIPAVLEGLTCPPGLHPAGGVGCSELELCAECQGDGKAAKLPN